MSDLSLRRPRPARAPISLVPMIDVLLILLVFFMVTSTYLDLDMIPAMAQSEAPATAAAPQPGTSLLLRLGADGQPTMQGRGLDPASLNALLHDRLADDPGLQVILLPTGGATMQALVSVMDQVTIAGVTRLRVVRLEARP